MAGAAPHGPSTKELLKLTWDYPVYQATNDAPSDGTSVKAPREALSREDAIRYIAGKDARPLLVLRECPVCNKTDNALLTPGADNDKTLFFSRWFHCVNLPVDVIQPDHPFNVLFPDNDAEHLFVSAIDGSGKIPLESDTSRVDLWSAMGRVLAAAYVRDPSAVYRDVRSILDKLDLLDRRISDLEARKAELMESTVPDQARLRKLDAEIEETRKDIASKREEVERLARIDLRTGGARAGTPTRASR